MTFVLGLTVFLTVYNNLTALLRLPAALYVPVNLAVAGALLWAAHLSGLSLGAIGLGRASVGPGLRWGGLVAAVAAGLLVGLFLPGIDRLLADRRVAGIGAAALVYQVLVRIPLGTVALEELAFRGVLFAAWDREGSVLAAVLGSSVVFGLWHIGPTLELLRINQVTLSSAGRSLVVVGAVAATFVGGLLLALLRIRTGGVLGPALAHAAINSLSMVAAFAARGVA